MQAAGAAVLGVFGFWALATGTTVGSPFTSSFALSFGVDGLTAFFLGVLGLVAAPVLVFAMRYLEPTAKGRAIGVLTGAFLLVLVEVLCARDPLTFLAGWELMTLLPAAMILVRSADRSSRHTVFVYVAITHLAGAGTWIAVLLAAHAGAIGGHCGRAGLGPADRDRACGAGRHGREGGVDAAAQLAAAGASDRSGAGVGADERRDDQDRDLRARARARRLARRACRSGSAYSSSPWVRSRRWAASSTRSSSTT